ncbi:ribonuclease P protein component [Geobacter sp. AOG1]|uniref:ribonuclease P protein component n=1 Tax=Geobacter sp. AOG1 TaxID=1566346 RepID=UPI001CC5712E|nr:ribonuclease P protein component [Geobacter sp. AOG1]GFE56981.1 ribonuclease P protein component [Geobacter sp. AOG1]
MIGFPKTERLRKRPDFLAVSRQGHKYHSVHFIILLLPSGSTVTRVGITASRKVGNAVVRNRIKRLVREFYRQHKELFHQADYSIIAKRGAERLDYQGVCQDLIPVLRRSLGKQC